MQRGWLSVSLIVRKLIFHGNARFLCHLLMHAESPAFDRCLLDRKIVHAMSCAILEQIAHRLDNVYRH